MDRREFLQYSLSLVTLGALNTLIPSCTYSLTKPVIDQAIWPELKIIDAHAHPDQFHHIQPSRIDASSTLAKIIKIGMKASVFAAVGDLPFFIRGPAPTFYKSARNQLRRALNLVEAGKVGLITKAYEIPLASRNRYIPGAILAIEGGDPMEGKVERVDEFYQLGVRIITLVHYRNNELGDIMKPWRNSNPGPYNNGLTKAGRKVIERMQEIGMVVDVAHAHPQTLKNIGEMNPKPLLDSHTNPCPSEDAKECGRMRTWRDMELVAKTGGIICTWPWAFWRGDYKRTTIFHWAQEILEMKKRLGIEHVGLGTDGGGNIPRFLEGYWDIGDLPKLVTAMKQVGLSKEDIQAYMGGNFYRLLQKCLG